RIRPIKPANATQQPARLDLATSFQHPGGQQRPGVAGKAILVSAEKREAVAVRRSAANGDAELAQNLRSEAAAVERMGAEIETETVAQVGHRAAAEVPPFLENRDRSAAA